MLTLTAETLTYNFALHLTIYGYKFKHGKIWL